MALGIKAYKHIAAGTVKQTLLEAAVVTKLNKIATIETNLNNFMAQKAANSGLCDLDAGGFVPTSRIKALYVGNTFVAANEAGMLVSQALDKRGIMTAVELGDVMIRTDQGGTSWKLAGDDPTVLANWVKLFSAIDGVTGVSVDGTTHTGLIVLAKVAKTGDINDLAGVATVAKTGVAEDVGIIDANGLFVATNVEAALKESALKIANEITDRQFAVTNAITNATLVAGTISGTQNGGNNTFTIAGLDTSKPMFFYRDGIEHLSFGGATMNGSTLTTVITAPESDEVLKIFGYPASVPSVGGGGGLPG